MSFDIGELLTRDAIAARLGVPSDPHAVIISGGVVLAIVVNKNGRHPSGKHYKNELPPNSSTFVMHGEYDERGQRLENPNIAIPLFFSDNNDGRYRYVGPVRYLKTTDWAGEPFYEFTCEPHG